MDSRLIASELEARYPSPSLHLDSPFLPRVEVLVRAAITALCPIFIPGVPEHYLADASQAYWERTRSAMFGMPCADYGRVHGGKKAWTAAAAHLQAVTALLGETDGVFFDGNEPGYADFVWVAFLVFFKDMGSEYWESLGKAAGGAERHEKLLEGCKEWLERDSY